MYITSDNISVNHIQRLSKLTKVKLWPTQEKPLLKHKASTKPVKDLVLVTKNPSESF